MMGPAILVVLPMSASTVTHHVLISKPSKTARKKEFHALQELGEQLIELTNEQLDGLDLDDRLRDAIVKARSITAHGALRRQKQLIGKLMRTVDPEPIRQMLHALRHDDRTARRIFHEAEAWRTRLINDGGETLTAYLEHLGEKNSRVADSLQDYQAARNEKSRKTAARRIFRDIHEDIGRKVQNEAGSI
jgi:ribosome-associated protein